MSQQSVKTSELKLTAIRDLLNEKLVREKQQAAAAADRVGYRAKSGVATTLSFDNYVALRKELDAVESLGTKISDYPWLQKELGILQRILLWNRVDSALLVALAAGDVSASTVELVRGYHVGLLVAARNGLAQKKSVEACQTELNNLQNFEESVNQDVKMQVPRRDGSFETVLINAVTKHDDASGNVSLQDILQELIEPALRTGGTLSLEAQPEISKAVKFLTALSDVARETVNSMVTTLQATPVSTLIEPLMAKGAIPRQRNQKYLSYIQGAISQLARSYFRQTSAIAESAWAVDPAVYPFIGLRWAQDASPLEGSWANYRGPTPLDAGRVLLKGDWWTGDWPLSLASAPRSVPAFYNDGPKLQFVDQNNNSIKKFDIAVFCQRYQPTAIRSAEREAYWLDPALQVALGDKILAILRQARATPLTTDQLFSQLESNRDQAISMIRVLWKLGAINPAPLASTQNYGWAIATADKGAPARVLLDEQLTYFPNSSIGLSLTLKNCRISQVLSSGRAGQKTAALSSSQGSLLLQFGKRSKAVVVSEVNSQQGTYLIEVLDANEQTVESYYLEPVATSNW